MLGTELGLADAGRKSLAEWARRDDVLQSVRARLADGPAASEAVDDALYAPYLTRLRGELAARARDQALFIPAFQLHSSAWTVERNAGAVGSGMPGRSGSGGARGGHYSRRHFGSPLCPGAPGGMIDPLAEAIGHDVPRETIEQLQRYVELLLQENARQNLIAPSSIPEIWTRHILDGAQLLGLAGRTGNWCDIGSGPGLPGMVIAILGAVPIA